MTSAGRSLFVFGFYVAIMGILLLAVPSKLTETLMLPPIPDAWGRVLGLLALVIAGYDFLSGRSGLTQFLKASIYFRLMFCIGIVALIVASELPVAALPLAFIDLLGAGWTALALRKSK